MILGEEELDEWSKQEGTGVERVRKPSGYGIGEAACSNLLGTVRRRESVLERICSRSDYLQFSISKLRMLPLVSAKEQWLRYPNGGSAFSLGGP